MWGGEGQASCFMVGPSTRRLLLRPLFLCSVGGTERALPAKPETAASIVPMERRAGQWPQECLWIWPTSKVKQPSV